ncbi:hypothetical protein AU255_19010 [Methyloprofundus sedimenti]|uniref:8-oxo-dGTP diphosphatase n=1 Tax=Methyloprofundus sedimenti TaxID=1420851 RepID=A0A1V8M132_9GAMM|nr:Nudix family hydrolase [Methyloprofundus sedimenti]OQK15249.1 hypothetical protein AU255_19010 [Methyloprofundus sedimenti]
MAKIDVAIGVVRDRAGRVLISKRKSDTHQGGLWEFPGGKIEQSENDEQALNRELFEELNIRVINSSPLIKINFSYPDLIVQLHVREVYGFDGEVFGREGQRFKWVALHELSDYEFPAANKPILTAIKLEQHYAIIGGNNTREILLELDNVWKQGVGLIQIRAKELCAADAEEALEVVRGKCKELNMTYLINSQMPVKRYLDEGVHLTSADLKLLNQRPQSSGYVAASCHNLQELYKAEQMALDFAVLSPVMPTSSHPEAKALGWQQFKEWVTKVNIPVFALGGISRQDFKKALACGAQGVSGISLYKG